MLDPWSLVTTEADRDPEDYWYSGADFYSPAPGYTGTSSSSHAPPPAEEAAPPAEEAIPLPFLGPKRRLRRKTKPDQP